MKTKRADKTIRSVLFLILAFAPLALLVGQSPGKTAPPSLSAEEFEKVLEAYDWNWMADGKMDGSVHFFKEGTARHSSAWTARWELTGPRTIHLTDVKNKKRHSTITFDDAAEGFQGTGFNGHSSISGWRQDAPLASMHPTPPAAPEKPLPPPPSVGLQSFFTAHLDQLLAPLDRNAPAPRTEVTQIAGVLRRWPCAGRASERVAVPSR